jgi:hypothetical protein
MQLTLPGAPHHPWQQLLAERVFDALLARLAADQLGLEAPAQRDSLDACAQQLAQVGAGGPCAVPPLAHCPQAARF